MTGAGIAMLACAACGSKPYIDYEPAHEPAGPRPQVGFTATITPDASGLTIDYRIDNTGPEPVLAVNGVPAQDTPRDPVPHQDAVYVTTRQDGTVEIAKRTFDVPEGARADARLTVRGTLISPGGHLAERVRVPLPLKPRWPYQDALESPIRLPDKVERVVYCVGVAVRSAVPMQPDAGPAEQPVLTHPIPQHLLCSAPRRLA